MKSLRSRGARFWWVGVVGGLALGFLVRTDSVRTAFRKTTARGSFAMPGEIRRLSVRLGLKEGGGEPRRGLSVGESGGRCLRDRLGAEAVRQEVTRLEAGSRRAMARIGSWSAEVPASQAAMLAVQNGRWFAAAQSVNLAGCTDAICVVNRIAGRPDGDGVGVKIYAWYLKMGYVLGATSDISDVLRSEMESRPATQFFFSEDELTAFWKLAQMLPPSFRSMPHLTVLHRIPQGEVLTDWMDESCRDFPGKERLISRSAANAIQRSCTYRSSGGIATGVPSSEGEEVFTCGDAGSQGRLLGNPGFIRLSDRCLRLEGHPLENRGFYWIGVTHELSHRLDYSISGAASQRGERRSTSEEWRSLSGWEVRETRDSAGQIVSRQWQSDSSKEGFVRDYAGTSPMEDWAESVAWARFSPEALVRVAPRKAAYLRDQVYGGRSFTPDGLLAEYRSRAVTKVRSGLLSSVQECFVTQGRTSLSSAATGTSPVPLSGSWTALVPGPIRDCLTSQAGSQFSAALEELRQTEWEACDVLAPASELTLRTEATAELTSDLERIVSEQAQVADLLRASRELRERLLTQTDKREAFLRCQLEADPRGCFSQAISARFDSVASDLAARLGATLETERLLFMNEQSYEAAHAGVFAFYRQLFAGFESIQRQVVQRLIERCATAPLEGALLASPFSGGTGYVSPGLLYCLNQGIAPLYEEIRRGVLEPYGLTLTGEGALRFTESAFFEPGILGELQRWVDAETARELAAFQAGVEAKANALADQLGASDLAWLASLQTRDQVRSACFERLSPLALVDAQGAKPRFQAPEQWARSWTESACSRFLQLAAVQSRMEAIVAAERAAVARAWQEALRDLEARVQAALQGQGASCRQRYPQRNSSARSQRIRCLRDQWGTAKTAAVREWLASPGGAPFTSRRTEAEQTLENARSRLLEAAALALER